MKSETKKRDREGKYTHELDRVCACGRRKGQHDAEWPYAAEDWDCVGFKCDSRSPEKSS